MAAETMAFFQDPPALGNQFLDDRVLRGYLARAVPPELSARFEHELSAMGELAAGKLFAMQREDRLREPVLTQWDPWGNRVDRIEVTPLWKEAARVAAERGVVATAYDGSLGASARVLQFALTYLFHASTDVYSCPLAMTDGAARTLLSHAHQPLIERAVTRLTSRDPDVMWTSGQWMTERTGGSDVGISETVARRSSEQEPFRLYGTKWFTSAPTSQMALTLARPEGNPAGSRGLALFYVEQRDAEGRPNGITVNRLKDKLGTRKVPTAELTLEGAVATPVAGLSEGVRAITPMLSVTRTWNSVCAVADMRRGIALARDYARRRVAFGQALADKPLHQETLAGLQAEFEGGFLLTFFLVELLGKIEAGAASDHDRGLFRLATPIVKATTGKQAVPLMSEVLESFGGAGYVEDTGLPRILRDAQVLPIWEGTTNVLSLDLLRAVGKSGTLAPIEREVKRLAERAHDGEHAKAAESALAAVAHARAWIEGAVARGQPAVEAGARRFALTLGRAWELALLVDQAAWASARGDGRAGAAARRFARSAVDLIVDEDMAEDARMLLED